MRLAILLLLAAGLAVFMLGPSLAEGPTAWNRADFIPATGTVIEGLSTSGLARLTTDKALGIPEGITEVAPHAFQDRGLVEVGLPASLEKIGSYAFTSNEITAINLEDTQVAIIASNAFRDNALTTVELPVSCIEVAENAFVNNKIAALDAPSVTTIASKAFANNKLTAITLPAITSIDASAFDTNGRVVAITTANTLDSYFVAGSGFVINPVTIRVNYVNEQGTAFRSPEVLGNDFTSANLYPSGVTTTINAPTLSGWIALDPTSYTQTLSGDGQEFDFAYRNAVAPPVITVSGRLIELGSEPVTEEMARSWVTATSGVDGSTITDITITADEAFPFATDIERDVRVTYRVTDSYGNTGDRTIIVAISPGLLYQQIIPGKGWQYIDFAYNTGINAGELLGLRTDLPGYGIDKYKDETNPFAKEIVLPGLNPNTGQPITKIADSINTEVSLNANTRYLGAKAFTSIDFSRMTDLQVIGMWSFYQSTITELDLTKNTALTTIGSSTYNGAASNGSVFFSAKLTELDLSNNPALTFIGSSTFQGSTTMTELKIAPSNVNLRILSHAFTRAILQELDLSGRTGALTIGDRAFGDSPLTSLKIGPSAADLRIENSAFQNSRMQELDLRGRTGAITIGDVTTTGSGSNGAFQSNAQLERLLIGQSAKELKIGADTFRNAKLTELDLSGRTGEIYIGPSAFQESYLRILRIGGSESKLTVRNTAFFRAEITELDLSGRSGEIEIGTRTQSLNGAFHNAPLTSLLIGPSEKSLIIDSNSFRHALLTELDLGGRTGPITIGRNDIVSGQLTNDEGAFRASPLTSLIIGPSEADLTIGQNVFVSAELTELDLSGRTGAITIGAPSSNDTGAFRNSPLTSLKFGKSAKPLRIYNNAFYFARLTELDLSGRTGIIALGGADVGASNNLSGFSAFFSSPLKSLKIGKSEDILVIGQDAFRNSELTHLDLSGRTGIVRIGGDNNWDNGAFRNAPITSLIFGKSDKELFIYRNAFYNARLTELDLSGRTGTITLGDGSNATDGGAFRESRLERLLIGPSAANLSIGVKAFYNARLTELDLSGRTGQITIGSTSGDVGEASAFYNSPLTSLKIGHSDQPLYIASESFLNAKLTELDLSGRTGLIRIGSSNFFNDDKGAFRNSVLTSLKIGGSSSQLFIGPHAFYNAQLTELDLSGRTGYISIGESLQYRSAAFYNSPLTSLKIGPSSSELLIGPDSFVNARLTELDLSGRTGSVSIGCARGTSGYSDEGVFRNSPITSLKFGSPVDSTTFSSDYPGIGLGINAFWGARLTELDLSQSAVRMIGNNAFYNSSFEYLIIGRLVGNFGQPSSGYQNNLYARYDGGAVTEIPRDARIVSHTDELPITILRNETNRNMLPKVPGYVLNPVFVDVHYVDTGGTTLWPSRRIVLQYPLTNHPIKAQPLYGWMPDAYEKTITVPAPATPQIIRETVTFTYTPFNPAELGVYEFTIQQGPIKDYDIVGEALSTQFDLFRSDPDSQNPFNDEGFIVRIYYDPKYVQYVDSTPPRSAEQGGTPFTVADNRAMGILSFTFPEGTKVGGVGPDIFWRLIPGYTQENTPYFLHIQYEDPQGNVYATTDEVPLSGYYLKPRYVKKGTDYYADVSNAALGFDNPLIPSMTYSYSILHPNPYSNDSAIPRWMQDIVVTDVLPVYTTLIDGVTQEPQFELIYEDGVVVGQELVSGGRAQFDPEKNPGWTLLADGITLEYRSSHAFVGSASIPRLILDFPYAKPYTSVFNRYDTTMNQLDPGQFEDPWEGSAFVTNWFYPHHITVYPPGNVASNKRAVNYGDNSVLIRWNGSNVSEHNRDGWFAGGELREKPEIAWLLTITGNDLLVGESYQGVIFRDHDLDDRLKYVGVDVGTLGPANIRAFAGDEVLVDIGPLVGRYDFDPAIQEQITSVEIYGSERVVPSRVSTLNAYVFTAFRDSTVDHAEHPEVLRGGTQFENSFTITADLTFTGNIIGCYGFTKIAEVHIRDLKATIGIHKRQSLPSNVILRDQLPLEYTLRLDHFNETNQTVVASYYTTTINNLKIIDVLPRFFEYDSFQPHASFVNATTGLKWRTVGGGFTDTSTGISYDILEITADTFRVGTSTNIGVIVGEVSPTSPPSAQLTNHVYLNADPQLDARYNGGRVTDASATLFNGTNNPFGRADISFSVTDLTVHATREFMARKYIRGANLDSNGDFDSWETWKSTGVVTAAGAEFQYRLALFNYTNYPRFDIDIVDVLPTFDDRNITVRNKGTERIPRNSAFDNTLVDVAVPAGYHWEFITHEVPANYDNGNPQSPDLYFDAQSWIDSRTATPAQIAQATAIRVIYSGSPSPVLNFMDTLEVVITMEAQLDGHKYAGERAWNSFAFRNTVDYPGQSPQHIQYQQPNAVWNMIPNKPARIEFRKVQEWSSTGLAGATFELYRVTSTGLAYVATATSQNHATATLRGLVVFEGIERDNYVIREVTPSPGFTLSLEERHISINDFTDANGTAAVWTAKLVDFRNFPAPTFGNLIIEKKDANGQLVPGIEFRFTPPNGSGLDPFTRVTGSDGRITLSRVVTGSWRIQEVSARGNLRPITFFVTVAADATTGPISQDPSNPFTVPATVLVERTPPHTFTVNNMVAGVNLHKIGVTSDTAWNTPNTSLDPSRHTSLASVHFELFRVNSNTKGDAGVIIDANVVTATNGRVAYAASGLRVNQLYYFKEATTQPSTFTILWDHTIPDPTLDENQRHYFWIDAAGKLYNGDPANGGVLYDFNRVVVKNAQRQRSGWLTINKSDWSKDTDGTVVRTPLEGVTFAVEREDALTGLWVHVTDLTTGSDGKIGPVEFKTGSYRFTEKATPDGYLTDATIRRFNVNATQDDQQFTYNIDNVAITPKLVKGNLVGVYDPRNAADVVNMNAAYAYLTSQAAADAYGSPTLLSVHKMVNAQGRIELVVGLGGAQFTIKEYAGLTGDDDPLHTWTGVQSAADGTFMIDGLTPALVFKEGNTYTFQETKAPTGYVGSDRIVTYQPRSEAEAIRANGGKWITFDNRAPKHRIVLSKFAFVGGTALPGATFELLHPDKTSVFPGQTFTSSNAGLIEFEGLVPGTYYLRETDAPDGFALDETYYRFVIVGDANFEGSAPPVYEDLISADETLTIVDAKTSSGDIFWVLYNKPDAPNASLSIKKTVAGADTSGSFMFQISTGQAGSRVLYAEQAYLLYDSDEDYEQDRGVQSFTDSQGRITLQHGQRAVIYDVALDDVFYVEEIATQGYRTSVTIIRSSGQTSVAALGAEIEVEGHDMIHFKNTKEFTFPFTGGTTLMIPALIGAVVTALAFLTRSASGIVRSRRRFAQGMTMLLTVTLLLAFTAAPVLAAQTGTGQGSLTITKYLLDDLAASGPANDGNQISTLPAGAQPLSGIRFRIQAVTPLSGAAATGSGVLIVSERTSFGALSGGLDTTVTTGGDGVVRTVLPQGYYLVTELPSDKVADGAAPFIVSIPTTIKRDNQADQVLWDVYAYPKNMNIEISKVLEYKDKSTGKHDSLHIGDIANWLITSGVPSRIAEARSFAIWDSYSEGLSYVKGSTSAVALMKDQTTLSLTEGTHYTLSTTTEPAAGGGKVTLDFTRVGMTALGDATSIQVRMSMLILPTAKISHPLENRTGLVYTDKDGNTTERDPGVEIDPSVHTGGVRILKVDAKDTKKVLAGAQFKVVLKSSTDFAADLKANGFIQRDGKDYTVTTDERGRADIVGLPYGGQSDHETGSTDYWLVEIAAPKGYMLPKDPVTIRIDATSFAGSVVKYTVTNTKLPLVGGPTTPPVPGGTPAKPASPTAPKTGDIISIASLTLLAGAAIAFIYLSSKKRGNNSVATQGGDNAKGN